MAQARREGRSAIATAATPYRCAIYTRKSTDEGLDNEFNSLDAQREAAEDYIRSQRHEGWTALPDRYDDGGFSGATTNRPAFQRLLADIEAGLVDCVFVYKYDRLSRTMLDFLQLLKFFERHRVGFVSVSQRFDTSTPVGEMTMNVLLSFAQLERRMTAERTRDKMSAARRRGRWTGGMPPLGYDVAPEGGRIVVNPTEAEAVRQIFRLYLETPSLLVVARELNRRGWLRKSWTTRVGKRHEGKAWDKANLRRLLTDPVYAGLQKLRGETFPGDHDAIVPKATFEKAQRLLIENRRTRGASARNRGGALLRGILRCAACDSGMVHSWTRRGARLNRYYVCSKATKRGADTCPTGYIRAGRIEEFVIEQIRGIGRDPALRERTFRQALQQLTAQRRALRAEAKRLDGDVARSREEVGRLVSAVAAAEGPAREALTAGLGEAQGRLGTLEARLLEVRSELAVLQDQRIDEAELARTLEAFDPIWDALLTPEKERVLALLIERAAYDVRTEDLDITFRVAGLATLAGEVGTREAAS